LDGVPSSCGETLELCAGLIDKDGNSPTKTAVNEVFEECGYRIQESSLVFVDSFRKLIVILNVEGPGFAIIKQSIFLTGHLDVMGPRISQVSKSYSSFGCSWYDLPNTSSCDEAPKVLKSLNHFQSITTECGCGNRLLLIALCIRIVRSK
uniref:Nudix hydrolase domain-containing protein n=1 Tax=Echinostoma caproni TaxID=27848 RepID=A0A183B8X1_9TREM